MRHSYASAARVVVIMAASAVVVASCASSPDATGASLSTTDVTGEWSQPSSDPPVNLTLLASGEVSGTDGCNQLNGTWTLDGSTVEFGDFASTMMACDDVDTWLSDAASATVSGDELTVLDDGGTAIGTLEKAK